MKIVFLILLSVTGMFSLSLRAQERDTSEIYLLPAAVKEPAFPGGNFELIKFVNSHIDFPQAMADTLNNEKVRCLVYIDQNGKVIPRAMPKHTHNVLSCKVWDVLHIIPDFIPGETRRGKSKFDILVVFLFTTDSNAIHSEHTQYIFIPVFPTDNPEYRKLLDN